MKTTRQYITTTLLLSLFLTVLHRPLKLVATSLYDLLPEYSPGLWKAFLEPFRLPAWLLHLDWQSYEGSKGDGIWTGYEAIAMLLGMVVLSVTLVALAAISFPLLDALIDWTKGKPRRKQPTPDQLKCLERSGYKWPN